MLSTAAEGDSNVQREIYREKYTLRKCTERNLHREIYAEKIYREKYKEREIYHEASCGLMQM
jgi:hypothetical protein